VLVNKHDEADRVAATLRDAGIRSVQRGTANVGLTPAATQWRWLLTALNRPAQRSAASLAALS
jgi:ATP-dependent exoDNAse (exonuclease V) beta subunit